MKKNFIKFVVLLAVALPMTMMTSCKDDENDVKPNSEQTKFQIDDGEYIKKHWLEYDEDGSIEGPAIGTVLEAAEPTVVYVGVDDLKDAQFHFRSTVAPPFAVTTENNGNMESVLKDSLGKEINRLNFTVVNDGKVLAKVKAQKPLGIEKYITEIRYTDKSLWPENALNNNLPFRPGRMYKYNGNTFVCISTPGYGREGLLIRDMRNYRHISTISNSQSEAFTANYPNLNRAKQISKELNNTVSGSRLWQMFCATAGQKDLKEFKKREYWTSTVDGENITVINLVTAQDHWVKTESDEIIIWHTNTKDWTMEAYKFYTNNKGEVKMEKANNGIWMEGNFFWKGATNPYPKVSEWTRDEEMEKQSESISLQ